MNLNSQLTRKNSRIKELNDKIKILEKNESNINKLKETNDKELTIKKDLDKFIKENSELKENINNLNKEKKRFKRIN